MSAHSEPLHIEPLALPFIGLVIVLLLGATQYANNLGFFFAFWLMALAVGGLIGLRKRLARVQVHLRHIDSGFAHTSQSLQIEINNAHGARLALALNPNTPAPATSTPIKIDNTTASITLPLTPRPRGVYSGGQLRISIRDHLGLLRVERLIHLGGKYWVYPTPQGERPLPIHAQPTHAQGQDDFHGLHSYQAGDSPSRIHWKSLAKSTPYQPNLRVKQFGSDSSPLPTPLLLDATQLLDLPLEARLSQLAAWILHCEHRGEPYALRVQPGNNPTPAGLGAAHRQLCLRLLAEAT
jgi:uncharacterized protein (DUF58 family)